MVYMKKYRRCYCSLAVGKAKQMGDEEERESRWRGRGGLFIVDKGEVGSLEWIKERWTL